MPIRASVLPITASSPSPIPGVYPQKCKSHPRFFPKHSISLTFNLFYSSSIIDYSDTELMLSEAYSTPSQPSSQAASSAAPSVPADRTRNRPVRKGGPSQSNRLNRRFKQFKRFDFQTGQPTTKNQHFGRFAFQTGPFGPSRVLGSTEYSAGLARTVSCRRSVCKLISTLSLPYARPGTAESLSNLKHLVGCCHFGPPVPSFHAHHVATNTKYSPPQAIRASVMADYPRWG